jgi:hypothetical protein
MFSRWGGPPALKGSIQQLEVGNPIHIDPTPIGKASTAESANLVCEEFQTAFLDSIVVGFENAILVTVAKPNHASVLNRRSEQLIQFRFGSLQIITPYSTIIMLQLTLQFNSRAPHLTSQTQLVLMIESSTARVLECMV